MTGVQFNDAVQGARPTYPLAVFNAAPSAGQATVSGHHAVLLASRAQSQGYS